MNKEFVLYEEALALKELGFNEECLGWYPSDKQLRLLRVKSKSLKDHLDEGTIFYLAPLYQQAFRWFREKHGLHHQIGWFGADKYLCGITPSSYTAEFETHKEAELSCLRKLIEIVEQKNEK